MIFAADVTRLPEYEAESVPLFRVNATNVKV